LSDPKDKTEQSKQAEAYSTMLQRVRHGLEEIEDDVGLKFHYAVDAAKEKAYELGELSREEADVVGDYLKRDVHDAAEYLSKEGKEFSDWLKFDVELVEARLADVFRHAINTTTIELQALAERAAEENIWYMGEVSGPGTFKCADCEHEIQMFHIQDLPACPKCGAAQFHRVSD